MGRGQTRKRGEIKAQSEDADNEGGGGVCKEFQMERRHPKEVERQIKRET